MRMWWFVVVVLDWIFRHLRVVDTEETAASKKEHYFPHFHGFDLLLGLFCLGLNFNPALTACSRIIGYIDNSF